MALPKPDYSNCGLNVIASIAAFEAMVANAGVTLVDFANSASQAPAVNHGQTATGMP